MRILTGQNGAPLALFLHVAVLLAGKSKGCLEDEVTDVVIPLEVRLLFLLLLLVAVRHHVRDLNVGKFRIQVFGIHLNPNKHGIKDKVFKATNSFQKKNIHK